MEYNLITKTSALDWYDAQQTGLRLELLEEIDKVMLQIQKNPKHFQKRYRNVRIIFTTRFPYGLYYTIEEKTVYVHAVLKMPRKPKA